MIKARRSLSKHHSIRFGKLAPFESKFKIYYQFDPWSDINNIFHNVVFTMYYGMCPCVISDFNICDNKPCLHGGQCTTFGGNYKCQCLAGTYGENCQSKYSASLNRSLAYLLINLRIQHFTVSIATSKQLINSVRDSISYFLTCMCHVVRFGINPQNLFSML